MPERLAAVVYGVISYLAFLAATLFAVAFIGDYPAPRSIDGGGQGDIFRSILVDLVLLGAFAAPHSIMARPAFKRWWTRIVPASCERSTYVLTSSLLLILLFWAWRPVTATIWQVTGAAAILLTALYWAGWLIAIASTFMIDHFELFGLTQVFAGSDAGAPRPGRFETPLLYRLVRHPLMLGFLIAFWSTPRMTLGHLLFAGMSTGYILVGVWFEERDLIAQFGATYERYRQTVPMLAPNPFRRRPR